MIAQLTGVVARTDATGAVIDVNGVGYAVLVPAPTLTTLTATTGAVTLLTHLVLRGQPDFEATLYGFLEATQVKAFRLLLGTAGVGPKVALALLSTLEVPDLARALSTNDAKALTKVPGVGPKLASRLCLELGDAMAQFAFEQRTERQEATRQTGEETAVFEDLVNGLLALGYSRSDARKAAERVFAAATDRTNVGALISAGLRLLSSSR